MAVVMANPEFQEGFEDLDPAQRAMMLPQMVIGAVIAVGGGAFLIWGSLKMKRLESWGIALAAAIVAAVPCVSPCCLLGLPIGIWALVVLNDDQVKEAFGAGPAPPQDYSAGGDWGDGEV